MGATVSDVRKALNDISTASLASSTIEQKISDGTRYVVEIGVPAAKREPVVIAYAAWQSFIISKDYYDSLKVADLQRKKDAEGQAKMLYDNFKRELGIALGVGIEIETPLVDRTPMFDDRPEDPYIGTSETTS